MNTKIQTFLLTAILSVGVALLGSAIAGQNQTHERLARVETLTSDDKEQLLSIKGDVSALRLEVQSLQANGTGPNREVTAQIRDLQDKADQISAAQTALIRRLRAKGFID